jgi:uncharacterized membrane protein YGL010W
MLPCWWLFTKDLSLASFVSGTIMGTIMVTMKKWILLGMIANQEYYIYSCRIQNLSVINWFVVIISHQVFKKCHPTSKNYPEFLENWFLISEWGVLPDEQFVSGIYHFVQSEARIEQNKAVERKCIIQNNIQ